MAARPAYSPWAPLKNKADTIVMHRTHTASSKSKDQSADITKRGGKDGMKLGAFLANVACATMNTLISSDREQRWVCRLSAVISCKLILQVWNQLCTALIMLLRFPFKSRLRNFFPFRFSTNFFVAKAPSPSYVQHHSPIQWALWNNGSFTNVCKGKLYC